MTCERWAVGLDEGREVLYDLESDDDYDVRAWLEAHQVDWVESEILLNPPPQPSRDGKQIEYYVRRTVPLTAPLDRFKV